MCLAHICLGCLQIGLLLEKTFVSKSLQHTKISHFGTKTQTNVRLNSVVLPLKLGLGLVWAKNMEI